MYSIKCTSLVLYIDCLYVPCVFVILYNTVQIYCICINNLSLLYMYIIYYVLVNIVYCIYLCKIEIMQIEISEFLFFVSIKLISNICESFTFLLLG